MLSMGTVRLRHGEHDEDAPSCGDVDFLVEAGRVELPSEKVPRKASTGLERL